MGKSEWAITGAWLKGGVDVQAHVRGSSRLVYPPDKCGTPPLRSRNSDILRLKERASVVSIHPHISRLIFFCEPLAFLSSGRT